MINLDKIKSLNDSLYQELRTAVEAIKLHSQHLEYYPKYAIKQHLYIFKEDYSIRGNYIKSSHTKLEDLIHEVTINEIHFKDYHEPEGKNFSISYKVSRYHAYKSTFNESELGTYFWESRQQMIDAVQPVFDKKMEEFKQEEIRLREYRKKKLEEELKNL